MLITHDLAVVTDIADTIVIMNKGTVVERGMAKTLSQTMQHPYTKALFAASAHQPERGTTHGDNVLLRAKRHSRLPITPQNTLWETGRFSSC